MGYPYHEDLTPGDFRDGFKPVKVQTDSLYTFGVTFAGQAEGYFGTLAATQNELILADAGQGAGSRSIGNSETLSELVTVADYAADAATKAKQFSQDAMYGCLALAHAASWMAEKYGAVDGFNAVGTASAVKDAFNPPPGAEHTTAKDRSRDKAAEDAGNTGTDGPQDNGGTGDPTNSGTPGSDTPDNGGTGDPTTDPGTDGQGNGNDNPFYTPEQENDYDPGHYYAPPTPDIDDGTTTLAPGPLDGTTDGGSPTVTA